MLTMGVGVRVSASQLILIPCLPTQHVISSLNFTPAVLSMAGVMTYGAGVGGWA